MIAIDKRFCEDGLLPIETRRKEFLPVKGWPPGKAGEREREREVQWNVIDFRNGV